MVNLHECHNNAGRQKWQVYLYHELVQRKELGKDFIVSTVYMYLLEIMCSPSGEDSRNLLLSSCSLKKKGVALKSVSHDIIIRECEWTLNSEC